MNGDLSADLRRILGIQAVRAFLYGFGAVILGASLAESGASDLAVGVLGAAIPRAWRSPRSRSVCSVIAGAGDAPIAACSC